MPTQITRVNPLDLQGNIAIGVALPFNQPGVFRKTYSTKDQIKSNLINLVLTNKGERVFNPNFGANIRLALFEGITEDTTELIQNLIIDNVSIFMPEIKITKVDVTSTPYETDRNILNILINYQIVLSGTSDQVTVEFT